MLLHPPVSLTLSLRIVSLDLPIAKDAQAGTVPLQRITKHINQNGGKMNGTFSSPDVAIIFFLQ